MADYRKLVPKVLKWEGGYAGNIDGMICTMKGVTLATFRKFFGRDKTCADLKKITEDQWGTIFKQGFWDRWKADAIESQPIAELLVDWTWGSGQYGITLPQRVLGVTSDGVVGPKTLAAVNGYPDQRELFEKLWNRRKKHFEDIAKANPAKRKFLKGWLNRLNDFTWE